MSLTDRLMEMREPLRTGLIELFTSEESHRAFRAATIDFANELIDRNPFDPELRPWFARLKVAWRDSPADLAAIVELESSLPGQPEPARPRTRRLSKASRIEKENPGKVVVAQTDTVGADGSHSRAFTFAEAGSATTTDNPWDVEAAAIRKKGTMQ